MNHQTRTQPSTASPVIIRALRKFDSVWFECEGRQFACTIKAAIHELRQRNKTLADVRLVDFDNMRDGPRSRQCQAIYDALLAAGLPDPVLQAAKARGVL